MDEHRPLKIDGKDYPVPSLETFTMDEWEILYDKTRLTLETIEDAPMSPGLLRTLLIVAYRRGNPDARMKDVERIIGALNFVDVLANLGEQPEDEMADPLAAEASSPPPNETSKPSISAPSSGSGLGTLAVLPPPTGTPPSVTQLADSASATSAG